MLAPVLTVARPIVVEGAKEGAKALVGVLVVYAGVIGAGLAGYGVYRGGRAATNSVMNLFRKKEQPAEAAADEAKATVTEAATEVTELFRKTEQAA